ncbi:MAG: hypothetical protein CME26_16790 [Gemmatimonadetes bacterium]|nr:hypothetical protein [Gemmatimonadota bacterium]
MISPRLRTRISELSRSALRRREAALTAEGVVTTPPSITRVMAGPADVRLHREIEDIAVGEDFSTLAGDFLMIDRPVVDFLPTHGERMTRRFQQLMASVQGVEVLPHDPHETFGALTRTAADRLMFIDIEATGFTPGTPLFLVGVVVECKGELRVRQLLARDYSEEAALLFELRRILAYSESVVSFNGKTYDLPYVRDRMGFFGYDFPAELAHIDLLHEGRRRYKGRLPNCKLQTLERAICKRGRTGDIPGEAIPDAYHAFVRTGNAIEIRDILHHNALDLVSLVEIVLFMLEGKNL